jgi:hypothetical protein
MHSYRAKDGSAFHFNSDFSGDIIVYAPNGEMVEIPAQDILDFVAQEYVLPARIRELEQTKTDEILLGISSPKMY